MAKDAKDLVVINRCRQELVRIKDLPTLLDMRDKLSAIAQYRKARDGNWSVANRANAIAALAEARIGQEIRRMKEAGQLSHGGDRKSKSQDGILISELGITANESSRYQLAADVLETDPDWFDDAVDLLDQADKPKAFTRQMVIRQGKQIRNERTGKRKPKTPRGKYDVIVIDPPWPMEMYERDDRDNQASFDYQTMTEDELADVEQWYGAPMPAAEDCHMWCWTTHKFLPMALRLLPVWGFKYVCTFVWHKDNSIQPFNLPKYNCEFALYARKGSPKFVDLKDFWCCFNAPRGGHSEKPCEFYEVVRRVTEGKRIDMFSRRRLNGFKGWGNEAV